MTPHDEALRALEKDLREEVALLRDMEGSCEHEQGIAIRAAAAMAESCAYKLAALLTTRQEVAPVADSLQVSMEAYANALAQHRDSEVVAFRVRRNGDESLGPMWVDGKPDASMISEWKEAGFWIEYAHAGPQGSIPGELDEAINCVVSDLEMIAAGRDTVTGDPVSSAQAQRIAKGAHDHLLAAWSAAATTSTGQTPDARDGAVTDEQCDAIYSALDRWARDVDSYDFGLPMVAGGGNVTAREVIRTAMQEAGK